LIAARKLRYFRQDIVFTASKIIFAWLLFAAVSTSATERTNYFCVVCGKGPLTGRIWMSKWGPVCDDCIKLQDRCSICGLPVKDGDGHITTPDGRIICRFDKTNAVLTLDQAKALFEQTSEKLVDLFGPQFALKYPAVTVSLFDVDYWSEKGQTNGLHKFGFASTRQAADGRCTHEVVMLSGRTRQEMTAVAAHEYTHLWINENRPENHRIDGDTVEAICDLTAYKLMGKENLPEMQEQILANPYTHGKIKDLVAVEREDGMDYVLNWVKSGTAETLDADAYFVPLPTPGPAPVFAAAPLPQELKFSGFMILGRDWQAVINNEAFAAGDQKTLKLRDRSVLVRCLEIHKDSISVEVDGRPLTLERGEGIKLP
jgi:hypothetical protein